MIVDASLLFSGAQSATGVFSGQALTTTAVSTNIIDLQSAAMVSGAGLTPPAQQGRDLGIAPEWYPIQVKSFVVTSLTGGTSINVQVQGAPDSGSGTPGSYYTIFESGVITVGNATLAGQDLMDAAIASIPAGYAIPRFLQLNYVIVGTMGAGSVFGGLMLGTDNIPTGPLGALSGYKPGFIVNN